MQQRNLELNLKWGVQLVPHCNTCKYIRKRESTKMGWRFRKNFKIVPEVKLNLNKETRRKGDTICDE